MAAQRSRQQEATKERPKPTPKPKAEGWSLAVRGALSALVVWHLLVVFLSPLAVPPSSLLVRNIAYSPYVRWYSDPLYLNHGYHFFGPDPPRGGNIIRWQVYGEDNRVIKKGEFPSLDQQWPRLWYHRHMMLADQAAGVGIYGDEQRDRELMLNAYARRLMREHGGARVEVESLFHHSLHPVDVRGDSDPTQEPSPADPSEPRYYESLMKVVQYEQDLENPLVPPLPEAGSAPELISIGGGG